jgi:hypothetical protein
MPLELRYSKHSGSAGADGLGTAALSLGKFCGNSASVVENPSLNNLFADEVGTGDRTDYRCLFIVNTDSFAHTSVVVWFSGTVSGGASAQMAVLSTENTVLTLNTGDWQAGLCCDASGTVDEEEAPRDDQTPHVLISYAWATPVTQGTGLAVGQIPAGYCQALWLKRTVTTGTDPLTNDGCTLSINAKHLE